MEICGTKYLFITYDYNPSAGVVNWLDEILGKYPDHRAILTTHSYLLENGKRTAACIGGMLSVTEGNVRLVPTTFEWAEDIDEERAARAAERAQAMLAEKKSAREFEMAQARLNRALVRSSVARRSR